MGVCLWAAGAWYLVGFQDHESDWVGREALKHQREGRSVSVLFQTQGPQQSFAVAHTSAG